MDPVNVDPRVISALGAIVLWSTNAWAAGFALDRMSVGWLLLVQYGTAAAAYLVVRVSSGMRRAVIGGSAAIRDDRVADRRRGADHRGSGVHVVAVGVVGLTGTIFLQYVAFALAPLVAANVLAYGWPLLAAIWIAGTRRDAPALAGAGFAVLGFAGVALIFAGPGQGGTAGGGILVLGYAAALGSALCMTVYTLASGRSGVDVAGLLLPATAVGTVAAGALVVLTAPPAPELDGVVAAVYIGVGPMALGYGLWTRAMSGHGAARFAPLGYATPMLSTGLLLGTGATATGSTIVGIGLVLVCSLGVLALDRITTARGTGSGDGQHLRRGGATA